MYKVRDILADLIKTNEHISDKNIIIFIIILLILVGISYFIYNKYIKREKK